MEQRYEKKFPLPEVIPLKRSLGFWQASICGIGIILGAGIYALVGVAAGVAGPALWLSFLIAGIIAGLTGLSYAELGSFFKGNAAEYDYVKRAGNKHWGLAVAFMMIFAAIFTASTVALGFGGYFERLTGIPMLWAAICLVIILSLINLSGIKQSAWVNTVFTLIEATGLLIIILLGIKHWGSVNLLSMPNGFSGVLQAGALVFFSFIGFESIVKLSEETKSPTKNIPRAILFSIAISTVIYVLVAISAVSLLSWTALAESSSPLADAAQVGLGLYTFLIMSLIAICSTTNTVLMDVVTTSRMVYGMAKQEALPKPFSAVNKRARTPHYAILAVSAATILFIFIEDLERVASIANFFTFLTFALINFSVIILRKKMTQRRPFRVPFNIRNVPIPSLLGGLFSLGMIYYVYMGII